MYLYEDNYVAKQLQFALIKKQGINQL